MKVPFLDLGAHHAPLAAEIEAAIRRVIAANAFSAGPFVSAFEDDFAAFCRTRQAIGVGSGTEALWLALTATGVGPGDEVITVPATFAATVEAILLCGATPVFVDVDETTCTMDPAALAPAVTSRTKAIVPVHLYGQTADMDPILAVARSHGLFVIEDACQAHGAEYKGRRAGSMGDAGCFSFYPGKNLGAFGEAGAVVTNQADLAERIRIFQNHGQNRKYHHVTMGWNSRMDGLQGAILQVKLSRLEAANARRRQHAARYSHALADVEGVVLPQERPETTHVYHLYSIRTGGRDAVMARMEAAGIGCGAHYPVPVHLQHAFRGLGYRAGAFPVAERLAAQCLSLPMFPELTDTQIDLVVDSLRRSVRPVAAA